jgi:hydroxymethylbilane synthase
MHYPLRIGTRGSQLALWQARAVATRLEASGIEADLVIVRTAGDRLQSARLSEVGGKRLFVKELEEALLDDQIDVAVHSAKDMPAALPEGLALAATLPRDDPRDALVLPAGAPGGDAPTLLASLGDGARIGTGSVRRTAQLGLHAPGARFEPIRGNVDTRLRKLDEGDVQALVLAAAGLRRLGLAERITVALPPDTCVPAPGQGIVAVEVREGDAATRRHLWAVHHEGAGIALEAERTVVAALGGGCQLPLGALATIRGSLLELSAVVCSTDGRRAIRARATGPLSEPAELGRRIAAELESGGAVALLDELQHRDGPVEGSY